MSRAVALCLLLVVPAQAATRSAGVDAALALAEQTGRDVAVYLHGSDWCSRGETLKAQVWDSEAFARLVGDGVILVAVDRPEAVLTTAQGAALKAAAQAAPADQAVAAAADGGSRLEKLAGGILLARGGPPDRETYAVRLRAPQASNALVLEALRHPSLANQGPGRPSNGSWALTEMAAALPDRPLKLTAAWADRANGDWSAARAIDGIAKPDNGWSADPGDLNGERVLVATLGEGVPADALVEVRLHFASQWAKHQIGCFRLRLAALGEAETALVRRAQQADERRVANRKLNLDSGNYPAVFVLDKLNRWCGTLEGLAVDTTAADLARRIGECAARRIQRDQFVAQAAGATGPAKAELLGQALDLAGCAPGWFGHHHVYRAWFDQLKAADPKDESGYQRKYTFNWGATLGEAFKLFGEGKRDDALAVVDRELAHAGNHRLSNEQIQYLHLVRYRLYRAWPEQSARQYDVLAAIVKLDPTTYLAQGCAGWLLRDKGAVSLTHGWQPRHLQPGAQTWIIDADTPRHFLLRGSPYRVSFRQWSGRHPLVIKSVALLADGAEVDRVERPVRLPADNNRADFRLQVPPNPDAHLALIVTLEAPEGTESSGGIGVQALLAWE